MLAMDIVGSIGVAAMEASYVPQLVRLHRLKRAEEVSLLLPGLSLGGRLCAVTFAASQGQAIFLAGFLLGIALRAGLFSQVLYYRWRERRQPAAPVELARQAA